jgi:prophage maintenance system killer protein
VGQFQNIEISYRVDAEQAEVVAAMLSLVEHIIDEAGYAQWLRDHAVLHEI